MATIHPTAIVDAKAELDVSVSVGPYAVIGPHVRIGAGSSIGAHCVVDGHTTIGRDNRIFQFASVGAPPQDKKYGGEPTRLEIGHGNTIREFVTINTGTAQDAGVTRLGDDNWIMAYVHVAHDCVVGNHTIFANNATLAGHVSVDDWAILGGMTGVHQFCRIGAHSFCGAGTILLQDLPPYVICSGSPAVPRSINVEGLKRRGFSAEAIAEIRRAYKTLYRSELSLDEARSKIGEAALAVPELALLAAFIAESGRGLIR